MRGDGFLVVNWPFTRSVFLLRSVVNCTVLVINKPVKCFPGIPFPPSSVAAPQCTGRKTRTEELMKTRVFLEGPGLTKVDSNLSESHGVVRFDVGNDGLKKILFNGLFEWPTHLNSSIK